MVQIEEILQTTEVLYILRNYVFDSAIPDFGCACQARLDHIMLHVSACDMCASSRKI